MDCLQLLTLHEPGNELHVVSEINLPGGSVDYFLVSAARGKVRDFVGVELQALDTTGTVSNTRSSKKIEHVDDRRRLLSVQSFVPFRPALLLAG